MAAIALEYRNYVLYVCHCSQRVTLDNLYFCRHCKLLRCLDCVSVQIDGTCISCPFCNESIPQADAKAKKYRCGHCYQCPMCSTPLATRFVQRPLPVDQSPTKEEVTTPTEDRKEKEKSPKRGSEPSPVITTPKSSRLIRSTSSFKSPSGTKLYYLVCTHCHWTTREVSIPDKRSLLDFKEQPHPFLDRYKQLLTYYKEFDMYERATQQHVRRQQTGRKVRPTFASLLDTSRFRREKDQPLKQVETIARQASDPESLPDSFYKDPIDITELCSLEQQVLNPPHQPMTFKDLRPHPLPLISRKTIRCKGCDHILLKPDVNVNLVRFKIQHVAIQVFPRLRLLHLPKLTLDEPSIVALSITSPVNYNMTISFEQFSETKKLKDILSPVALPEGTFTLRCVDDISDILDESESTKSTNLTTSSLSENDFVLTSEPGRLILKFAVIPTSCEVDAKIAFLVRFTYEPLIETDSDPGSHELTVPVLVNCGHAFV